MYLSTCMYVYVYIYVYIYMYHFYLHVCMCVLFKLVNKQAWKQSVGPPLVEVCSPLHWQPQAHSSVA